MVKIIIDAEKCDLCGFCARYCPAHVFVIREGRVVVDETKCIECYGCVPLCPRRAIKIIV